MAELNLILLGPPGAGKGTQADRLIDDFDLPYYATGNMLRTARTEGSELGNKAKEFMDRGDLVPDDLVVGLIVERVKRKEAEDGFILDGFPRTVPQAEALDAALAELSREISAVLLIEVPDDEVVKRLSGRRVCKKDDRHTYHVDFDPPKREGVCDQDGHELIQRDDDKPETVRHRLGVYHDLTQPLVKFYEKRGMLRRFDGCRPAAEVHDHIRASLATLKLESEL